MRYYKDSFGVLRILSLETGVPHMSDEVLPTPKITVSYQTQVRDGYGYGRDLVEYESLEEAQADIARRMFDGTTKEILYIVDSTGKAYDLRWKATLEVRTSAKAA